MKEEERIRVPNYMELPVNFEHFGQKHFPRVPPFYHALKCRQTGPQLLLPPVVFGDAHSVRDAIRGVGPGRYTAVHHS